LCFKLFGLLLKSFFLKLSQVVSAEERRPEAARRVITFARIVGRTCVVARPRDDSAAAAGE
jgi:hypothetical protein